MKHFIINKLVNMIPFGNPLNTFTFMLMIASFQISCYSNIENAICFIG